MPPFFKPRPIARTLVAVLTAAGVWEFHEQADPQHAVRHEPHTHHEMPRGPEQIPGARANVTIGTGTTMAFDVFARHRG
jgi:hypothetical protein